MFYLFLVIAKGLKMVYTKDIYDAELAIAQRLTQHLLWVAQSNKLSEMNAFGSHILQARTQTDLRLLEFRLTPQETAPYGFLTVGLEKPDCSDAEFLVMQYDLGKQQLCDNTRFLEGGKRKGAIQWWFPSAYLTTDKGAVFFAQKMETALAQADWTLIPHESSTYLKYRRK